MRLSGHRASDTLPAIQKYYRSTVTVSTTINSIPEFFNALLGNISKNTYFYSTFQSIPATTGEDKFSAASLPQGTTSRSNRFLRLPAGVKITIMPC
jgi:hypothetical protein